MNLRFVFCQSLKILSLLSLFIITTSNVCICGPELKKENPIPPKAVEPKTWVNEVMSRLKIYIEKLEIDLEIYLESNYVPYLRLVGAELDPNTEYNKGFSLATKAMLRLSTIHAYLIIHQTALASAAVSLFFDYLKKQSHNFQLHETQLRSALVYINIQLRTFPFENKAEYIHEYAYLCERFEKQKISDKFQYLIDFVKARTKISLTKAFDMKAIFLKHGRYLKTAVKEALDFKLNKRALLAYTDKFYRKHGLEYIISGYLFMSADKQFKPKNNNRKFSFKHYFESCESSMIDELVRNPTINDAYDPILPLYLNAIPKENKHVKDEADRFILQLAENQIKVTFYRELIKVALHHDGNEADILATLINGFNEVDFAKELYIYDKKKKTRAKILFEMTKKVSLYQILKGSIVDRFINMAKSHIGFEVDNGKTEFKVPFNNHVNGLHVQQLLLSFYPAMVSQASFTMSCFEDLNLDQNLEEVAGVSRRLPKTSKLYQLLVFVYTWIKEYKRREEIISNVRKHKLREKIKQYRKLPVVLQGYYVGLTTEAMLNVLSLYLEPPYNQNNQLFDYVQTRILENYFQDHYLGELSVTEGKPIEANVYLWQSLNESESDF